jgi:hypothetical protein
MSDLHVFLIMLAILIAGAVIIWFMIRKGWLNLYKPGVRYDIYERTLFKPRFEVQHDEDREESDKDDDPSELPRQRGPNPLGSVRTLVKTIAIIILMWFAVGIVRGVIGLLD